MSNFFSEQFSWAVSNFFADVSSKIIALADPVLSQPDMEWEMVSPPAGAYIPSFTIYHLLPDLPGSSTAFLYHLTGTSTSNSVVKTFTGVRSTRALCAQTPKKQQVSSVHHTPNILVAHIYSTKLASSMLAVVHICMYYIPNELT